MAHAVVFEPDAQERLLGVLIHKMRHFGQQGTALGEKTSHQGDDSNRIGTAGLEYVGGSAHALNPLNNRGPW